MDRVDENEIIKTFTTLREDIQRVVHQPYQMLLKTKKDAGSLGKMQRAVFTLWDQGLRPPELRNRVRGKIFELLCVKILHKPIFGLSGFGTEGSLETSLGQFELALRKLDPGKLIHLHFQASC